jgi:hypothetical protein
MEIETAQLDVQRTFLRGSIGQAVTGIIWLVSAALGTWGNQKYAILVLMLGGVFIFPLTQLILRLLGRPAGLPSQHPMNALAMQVAFIAPLSIPLVLTAALYNINWFFPAFMIAIGAHYLPFVFLYGMREFGVLAALLIGGGAAISLLLPHTFALGGWITSAILLAFAVVVQLTSRSQRN